MKLTKILKEIKVVGNIPNFDKGDIYSISPPIKQSSITRNTSQDAVIDLGKYWGWYTHLNNKIKLYLYQKDNNHTLSKVGSMEANDMLNLKHAYEIGNYKIIK